MTKRFRYRALNEQGREVSGRLEAAGEPSAVRKLQQRGLKPFEIRELKGPPDRGFKPGLLRRWRAPMNRRQRQLFTRQMSTLLDSGVPLLRSVRTLKEQFESTGTRDLLEDVERDLREGSSFSEALSQHPRVFDTVYVNVIRAGEMAGELAAVLERLADFQQRREEIRTRVGYAALYPLSVLGFSLVIGLFLVVWVLPVFARMYRDMNVPLPLPTRVLMGIRFFVHEYGAWLGAFGVVAGGCLAAALRSPWGRSRVDRLKLSVPILGPLYRMSVIARFTRTLGILVETGVPILEALETAAQSVGNRRVQTVLKRARRRVSQGGSMSRPLEESTLFSPMVVRMISVGEQTGQLGEMLSRIAQSHEFRVESSVEGLSSVLQPVLLVVLGGVVGVCVLSMFLPMLNMVDVIGIR